MGALPGARGMSIGCYLATQGVLLCGRSAISRGACGSCFSISNEAVVDSCTHPSLPPPLPINACLHPLCPSNSCLHPLPINACRSRFRR